MSSKKVAFLCAFFGVVLPVYGVTGAEVAEKATAAWDETWNSFGDYKVEVHNVTNDADGKEISNHVAYEYFKKPDKTAYKIIEYYEEGKKKDVPGGEGESLEVKWPFESENFNDYHFAYVEAVKYKGVDCDVIKFTSNKEEKGYIYGKAWVGNETGRLYVIKCSMYKNPKHVTKASARVYFDVFDGRNMVSKMVMSVDYSAYLIFSGTLEVTDIYKDYQFDVGLTDARFK
jgi:hypothetical protein